ncbi:hypothetical protein DRF59_03100 [Chryseobacterium flavum]|uniref:Uncharacterized protein n=1 Tax=Chryseobacterium flavum TaxID=415851 RepID=A0A3D9CSY3_9FLAO|nr:hypothetical protein DRF59_03100 [Chryseobacterium flavum]
MSEENFYFIIFLHYLKSFCKVTEIFSLSYKTPFYMPEGQKFLIAGLFREFFRLYFKNTPLTFRHQYNIYSSIRTVKKSGIYCEFPFSFELHKYNLF